MKSTGDSDVRPWLSGLSYKMQAVLLSALRGCDGVSKHDPSKPLTRRLRGVLLFPADPNYQNNPQDGFMKDGVTPEMLVAFLGDIDKYPVHWLLHFMHAVEIVGYYHPITWERIFWISLYYDLTNRLHVNAEEKWQLDLRLADTPAEPDSQLAVDALHALRRERNGQ